MGAGPEGRAVAKGHGQIQGKSQRRWGQQGLEVRNPLKLPRSQALPLRFTSTFFSFGVLGPRQWSVLVSPALYSRITPGGAEVWGSNSQSLKIVVCLSVCLSAPALGYSATFQRETEFQSEAFCWDQLTLHAGPLSPGLVIRDRGGSWSPGSDMAVWNFGVWGDAALPPVCRTHRPPGPSFGCGVMQESACPF